MSNPAARSLLESAQTEIFVNSLSVCSIEVRANDTIYIYIFSHFLFHIFFNVFFTAARFFLAVLIDRGFHFSARASAEV